MCREDGSWRGGRVNRWKGRGSAVEQTQKYNV